MSSLTSRTLALLAICACGKDAGIEPDPPDGVDAMPDSASTRPPDAPPAATVCDEARLHSDLAWIQANVFTTSCALGSCHHGSAVSAGGLSLESGLARGQLVNTASTSAASWMRVVPSDTTKSYLLVAIGAQSGPLPKDGVMPLGGSVLCAEKRDAIKRWIQAGAPP